MTPDFVEDWRDHPEDFMEEEIASLTDKFVSKPHYDFSMVTNLPSWLM